MDTSISLRINGNPQHWGGSNSPQGERQNRRSKSWKHCYTASLPVIWTLRDKPSLPLSISILLCLLTPTSLKLALLCKAVTYTLQGTLRRNCRAVAVSFNRCQSKVMASNIWVKALLHKILTQGNFELICLFESCSKKV